MSLFKTFKTQHPSILIANGGGGGGVPPPCFFRSRASANVLQSILIVNRVEAPLCLFSIRGTAERPVEA